MAIVDLTVGGLTAIGGGNPGQLRKVSKVVDFKAAPRDAADVLNLIDVPAGAKVMGVSFECLTVEGGTLTMDIGDTDDPNGWDDAADGNSLDGPVMGDGDLEPAKIYATSKTIDATLDHDADAGKIRVSAFMFMDD